MCSKITNLSKNRQEEINSPRQTKWGALVYLRGGVGAKPLPPPHTYLVFREQSKTNLSQSSSHLLLRYYIQGFLALGGSASIIILLQSRQPNPLLRLGKGRGCQFGSCDNQLFDIAESALLNSAVLLEEFSVRAGLGQEPCTRYTGLHALTSVLMNKTTVVSSSMNV